ncbi:L-2-hydroxyglutarate oxidase [Desulfohalobiaceae bacterium Ax17]|jgi:L-2-hydroxyglutarate oxidase LhgO|uniref:L-2-hydroxyglutarate oxidase n=1 Tax=Desulfovulcanus ferrireducens TaxID=2831190 RepID=UPI00207BC292|nr:L-2-hydroxyglutarate oxidase [Desulfovulcanus ferrireducens]MBT8762746.1 L-2-hydroxyglutarate oxidase [Desulfovulcanus ferrireducens]
MLETDILIVGAGIVGLSLARELTRKFSNLKITILEKESEVAFHASGRNSGVLHAGFYYDANTLKAKFTVKGNKALTEYCLENSIPINQCGKVVVAVDEKELDGIYELKRRGDTNGVSLEIIDEKELNEIEPNAKTFQKALFSPTTSTVNPKLVCNHIASNFSNNVRILFNRIFLKVKNKQVTTNKEKIKFKYLYNAAGLYADKIAHSFGIGQQYTVLPFKGIYLAYNDDDLIKRHIYPVPNLKNPFLGVHFTKTVNNHVKIGPTAIPAFWRENYTIKERFNLSEFLEIIACQSKLFITNSFNFRSLALSEIKKYDRNFFINEAKKLVKQLDVDNFGDYLQPGIRAQLLNKQTNQLVMDFVVEHAENSTHVLNSVSPAFTTAFAFAEFVIKESEHNFN